MSAPFPSVISVVTEIKVLPATGQVNAADLEGLSALRRS
jgi:hypothetical protein